MGEGRRENRSAERGLAWAAGGVAAIAALVVGGSPPTSQVALSCTVLALFAATIWVRRHRTLRIGPFVGFLIALAIVPLVQLIPLPAQLVHLLSPAAHAIREEVDGAGWMPLTLDIPATLLEVTKAFASVGLFVVTSTVTRRSSRPPRAGIPIAIVGGASAILFFAQRGTHAQSVLGLYTATDPVGMSVVATFINKNHGASFLSLSALMSAGMALDAVGWRRVLFASCAALGALATLGAVSRSGAIGLSVGAVLLLALTLRRRFGGARAVVATVLVASLFGTATLWISDSLRSRLAPGSLHELVDNPKLRGWRDGLRLARHYPWTGAGRGAFESAVAAERSHDEGVRLVYAENGIVQLFADTGFLAGTALLVLLFSGVSRVGRRIRSVDFSTLGALVGVTAVAVHDLADFSLELLGVALPTVVALGIVAARTERGEDSRQTKTHPAHSTARRARLGFALAAVAGWSFTIAGGAWASARTLDADIRVVAAADARDDARTLTVLIEQARRRHPAADYFELVAARRELRANQPAVALKHLNRALRLHPAGWQGHRLAARALVALDQRRQAALELRLQADAGVVPSHEEALAVVGDAILDTVPQRPRELMDLARWLARKGRPGLGDEAARRASEAVSLDGGDDAAVALERLEIAVLGGERAIIRAAATDLLRVSQSARSAAAAAEALNAVKLPLESDEALRLGFERAPANPGLRLIAARIAFSRDDFSRAIGHLRHLNRDSEHVTLGDRRAAEELLARIYDKTGETEAAVMARARVRLIERQMQGFAP